MPEEFDRHYGELGDESPVKPHARAFGAGLVDPMGLPSWVANKIAGTPGTDWYERYMQEKRNESPVAAGMGSAVPMAAGGLTYAALRNAAMGYRAIPGAFAHDMLGLTPPSMIVGGGIGGLRELLFDPARKHRPQAAYPPGGAY